MDYWLAGIAGAAGGFALGLAVLALNVLDVLRSDSPRMLPGQLLWTHLVAAAVLALAGGIVAHFLTGPAGDFMQGVTAIGFLLILGGSTVSSRGGDHEPGATGT